MWTDASVFYQIYPLGAFKAPFTNAGKLEHRFLQAKKWIPHLKKLGISGVLFNPLFQSISHGYDTTDFFQVDCRLGTNEDVKEVLDAYHQEGIKVLFDGVFNHVGREFFAFKDVLEKRENSPYKDWFFIDFNGNTSFNDGFWYQNWEGNEILVKLNLKNPEVVAYLLKVIDEWMDYYCIDGIRFDVAYCLDHDFLKTVRSHCKAKNPDFFLLGETLHGDYNVWMNDAMLDSCTNYECYKGLYSSFNSRNFFEILYSLNRQFGQDPWCLYTGKMLWNFVDNHDVVRIASVLTNKKHLPLIYTMLMTMPGIPCIYYGSEWGIEGQKNANDTELRPAVEACQWNELTDYIAKLIAIKKSEAAFHNANYKQIAISNTACIYQRNDCLVCINLDEKPCTFPLDFSGEKTDLLTDKTIAIDHTIQLDAYRAYILK